MEIRFCYWDGPYMGDNAYGVNQDSSECLFLTPGWLILSGFISSYIIYIGKKPLPLPMLALIYVAIQRH